MLSFEINNQRKLEIAQEKHDGSVIVTAKDENSIDYQYTISPGDFVMILNWYRYQKENGNDNLTF